MAPSCINNQAVICPETLVFQDETVAADDPPIEPPLRLALTMLGDKVLRVTAAPVAPVLHVVPLLLLYCQVEPASNPFTRTAPFCVMPSLLFAPVSDFKLMVGIAGAVVTTVRLSAALRPDSLPAASVNE